MALTRFGYASLQVMDVDAAARHYVDIVGLRETDRVDGKVYLQAKDNQDHHCIILNPSDSAGLESIGFKVNDPADLDNAAAAAEAAGANVTRIAANEIAGQGEGVQITLPSTHLLTLYYHADKIGYACGMENPDPVGSTETGGKVNHLDHCLISAENPAEVTEFLVKVLDFGQSERAMDPGGNMMISFLFCGNTMHDLALGPGPNGHLHHLAFMVDDRGDVVRGVDLLKEKGVPTFDYGLSRHGIGGVQTVYFHDPSGNRNEFFSGAYVTPGIPDRVPPITWTMDHLTRGAFYYENAVPETFFDETT
ncbi:MAG: VOC family protein [Gammaproteobacteria bacterium]|nr:VOC family protein [Gammaproteobacteria bacterium]